MFTVQCKLKDLGYPHKMITKLSYSKLQEAQDLVRCGTQLRYPTCMHVSWSLCACAHTVQYVLYECLYCNTVHSPKYGHSIVNLSTKDMAYCPSIIPTMYFEPPKEENLSTKNKSVEFMLPPKCPLFGGFTVQYTYMQCMYVCTHKLSQCSYVYMSSY